MPWIVAIGMRQVAFIIHERVKELDILLALGVHQAKDIAVERGQAVARRDGLAELSDCAFPLARIDAGKNRITKHRPCGVQSKNETNL